MLGRMQPPQLRQMRYVVEVAKLRSFTRAAERLHVAQQALSQQVKVVEHLLGVRLFVRTSHGVELTPAGVVFAQEARRVLNAADRVVARTQAAERGEHGVVRVAYTLATVYGTLPAIIDGLAERHPSLKVELREVFGGDVEGLLLEGRYDVAACPRTAMRADIKRVQLRREPFIAALSQQHRLAARDCLTVAELAEERFEVWPRDMAPGFYDAVVGACRDAGFEPTVDEHASGSTVWRSIEDGRGVGLVVRSAIDQLARGIRLVLLAEPAPELVIDLVWHAEQEVPALRRVIAVAADVAAEHGWAFVP
jgi:DNA-binding transcriptional LysR family regulator